MQPVAWLVSGRRLFASAKILLNDQGPVADRYWAEAERVAREAARRGIRPAWGEMAFPVPNFDGAYLLLAYTIENLLKGLLIAQKKEHISESKLPKNLRSHDLWELYKMSGAKTELQERTLRSLTYMSVWRGRYPAPTSPQDLYFRSDNGR
jgi:hypothetical protein